MKKMVTLAAIFAGTTFALCSGWTHDWTLYGLAATFMLLAMTIVAFELRG